MENTVPDWAREVFEAYFVEDIEFMILHNLFMYGFMRAPLFVDEFIEQMQALPEDTATLGSEEALAMMGAWAIWKGSEKSTKSLMVDEITEGCA
jgi:hypothetical protein